MIDDGDATVTYSMRQRENANGRSWSSADWTYDDVAALDDAAVGDLATGLTSLAYIRASLRRRARLWCSLAVVGLIVGAGVFVKFPATHQAQAVILLANGANMASGAPIADDQAMAQSIPVAEGAVRQLGLNMTGASFLSKYTVTVVTDRVLVITAYAKSSDVAVREASAISTSFLAFQANLLKTQADLVNSALQLQVTQAQQHVDSLEAEIAHLSAERSSPPQQTQLNDLRAAHATALQALASLKQTIVSGQAAAQASNTATIKGTSVLSPAVPVQQHSKKRMIEYIGGGLLAGLVLGMAIVIIGALASDRLRRRDDIARALGAPVRLSVGKLSARRSRLSPGLAEKARQSQEIRRIVNLLDSAIKRSDGPASLAVVPTDDLRVAAISLVALAVSHAERGARVVVADLCSERPAATLLGMREPGVRAVTIAGTHFVIAVPAPDELPPAGPLGGRSRRSRATGELAAACSSADLLLTLASLDPAVGADHLPEWAARAVVFVTAGTSSGARIRSVGEMIRVSGTGLAGAVLIGADKADQSLGLNRAGTNRDPAPGDDGLPAAGRLTSTADDR
jgi:capsular polysaccharide biosynthesis protein